MDRSNSPRFHRRITRHSTEHCVERAPPLLPDPHHRRPYVDGNPRRRDDDVDPQNPIGLDHDRTTTGTANGDLEPGAFTRSGIEQLGPLTRTQRDRGGCRPTAHDVDHVARWWEFGDEVRTVEPTNRSGPISCPYLHTHAPTLPMTRRGPARNNSGRDGVPLLAPHQVADGITRVGSPIGDAVLRQHPETEVLPRRHRQERTSLPPPGGGGATRLANSRHPEIRSTYDGEHDTDHSAGVTLRRRPDEVLSGGPAPSHR